jgi:RNA polymerase sigma-70 factor (ECF subfamily)
MEDREPELIALLGKRDEAAFERVFTTWFKSLHAYACTIVRDEMVAEEMVQNVFLRLWERTERLTISGSVAAYLYRAVHNESLNYLKREKRKTVYQMHTSYHLQSGTGDTAPPVQAKELEERLHQALSELPEQCRTIFQLSRFSELRYREIADELGISVKTVENQMGKALKLLRLKLVEFLPILLLYLAHLLNRTV